MVPSPPPGLGGGGGGGGNSQQQQQQQQGPGSVSTIVKAQIVFLLSTLTEEGFERNAAEIRTVSIGSGWMPWVVCPAYGRVDVEVYRLVG